MRPPLRALLAALVAVAPAAASSLETRRIERAPVIDGVLDDEAWSLAASTDAFVMVDPVEGGAPSVRTRLWVAHDEHHLYLAFRCEDPEPGRIVARQWRRDSTLDGDDLLRIALAPFVGGRDGYVFEVNPAGTQRDGLIENNRDVRYEWDGLWRSAARIDASGWTAEVALPAKSLAFPSGDAAPAWGLDVERVVRRRQEVVRWANHTRTQPVTTIGGLGTLDGVAGLRQGRGIDLKPYLLARHRDRRRPVRDRTTTFTGGFDLPWRITPQLSATLTVNTDFADAEVDEREINLTRFPLFFPEKRAFFLQDAALFAFGGIGDGGFDQTPYPIFTRRIGLTAAGQPVDLLAGVKLTGAVGPASVGALVVRQDASAAAPETTLAVARVLAPLGGGFSAGLLYTGGDPRGDFSNHQVGADLNFFDPDFRGGKSLQANAWLLTTFSERAGADDAAGGVKVAYPHEPWELFASFAHYGSDFDPALGFVSRTGVRRAYAYATRAWRPQAPWLRKAALGLTLDLTTDLDGDIVAAAHDAPYFELVNPAGDRISGTFSPQRERLEAPFAIVPGIVIPPGNYSFDRTRVQFRASAARALSGEVRVIFGDSFGGTRTDYRLRLVFKPSPRLEFRPGWELRRVRLPQGGFDVRIVRTEAIVAFSPTLVWSVLGQHDNLSRTAGFNSRLRWTVQPGADVFLVVDQGYVEDDDFLRLVSSDVSLKAGWTFRF